MSMARSLSSRSINAVFWGAGGSAIRIALQFAVQLILARILGPAEYGVFAVGALIVSFSTFFSDFGLAYGLIQKEKISNADIRFVVTWQIILGSAVTGIIVIASPRLASMFNVSGHEAVVAVLSVVCLLNALAAPGNNLLARELRFKAMHLARIASYIGGYVFLGLPMAIGGFGVWALVVAWVGQALIFAAIVYWTTRHSMLPLLWHKDAKKMFTYGVTVLITNLVNWSVNNMDRVIVGRAFPVRELGLYSTSYNLVYMLTSSVLGVVHPVFFSTAAKLSGEPERLAAGYRGLLGGIFLFALPTFAGLAVVADTFILAVYGEQWRAASELLAPLALSMPMFAVFGVTTPILWASGSTRTEFYIQLPFALLFVIALPLAAQISIVWVAWTVCALFFVRCIAVMFAASKVLALRWHLIWLALRGGLIVTVFVAGSVKLVDLSVFALPAGIRLLLVCVAGAASLYLTVWIRPKLIGEDLESLLVKISARCHPALAGAIDAITRKSFI